jgi:hypothetical protein
MDTYVAQENMKIKERASQFRCGYCQKQFVNEHYMDLHLDRKHTDKLGSVGNKASICVADYCNVLSCIPQTKEDSIKKVCKPDKMKSDELMCHVILDQCFPPQVSATALKLNGMYCLSMYNVADIFLNYESHASL